MCGINAGVKCSSRKYAVRFGGSQGSAPGCNLEEVQIRTNLEALSSISGDQPEADTMVILAAPAQMPSALW
jgi:hypothetical protein